MNRELSSWLEFNRRVLRDCSTTPSLLERVKFLSIFGTNLGRILHMIAWPASSSRSPPV
ncbi:MAG: hypothetical protein U0Z44_13795 [Kouleothrix sp.]